MRRDGEVKDCVVGDLICMLKVMKQEIELVIGTGIG